jgi:multiple RNA-binding domain-containing protein 1
LAETNIIDETKEYLKEHGVDLDAFGEKKKSSTVILVKNIPASTTENELIELFETFGELGRVLVPPARTIGVVEFEDRNSAKAAFRKLAYKKFKSLPLYLEWAPEGTFTEKYDPKMKLKTDTVVDQNSKPTNAIKIKDDDKTSDPTATIFVKNLNFKTTDQGFKDTFSAAQGLISSKISMKNNKGVFLSMGFGFLEFKSVENAMECLKTMQGFLLDGHELLLKFSKNNQKSSQGTKRKAGEQKEGQTKLLVKNLPFEATKKDLLLLFE